MDEIDELLRDYKKGEIDHETIKSALLNIPYKDLEDVKIDTLRDIRKGLPEAVYCPGKSDEQLSKIAEEGDRIFTRADKKVLDIVSSVREDVEFFEDSGIIVVGDVEQDVTGDICVVTAGSSDVEVAEEAAVTLDSLGYDVTRIYDVGIAGVHRLIPHLNELRNADGIIVAAGMDGALPGFVSGLVGTPVIGIPTSVGYGVAREGRSALETMLNSCATGLAVVNIDNGYGAAAFVHHMLGGKKDE
ncbi:MAG: nickel pincer cofactor biosynthesis protein LarB [Thermoplasmatota archaeon]